MPLQILEKMKELREWATFGLSFITVLAIPGIWLILHNQRLEIEQEISKAYVQKSDFDSAKVRLDSVDRDNAQAVGEIRGQLNSILIQQARMEDSLSVLKDSVRTK